MKIAVLASGRIGLSSLNLLMGEHDIVFVATDKHSDAIIELATQKSIPLFVGNPRSGRLFAFAHDYEIDILFSINYLFLLEEDVLSLAKYPINLHGSLLPKYRGRTPHVWAIINGEKEAGITAHLIDNGCDTGNIILQEKVLINDDDSGADILGHYTAIYPKMLNSIIKMVETGKVFSVPQNHSKGTWFGKRIAEDGIINWNWFKERIKNWVRAQKSPYPGAFTFSQQTKIIIDEVTYSENGFSANDENGLVLSTNPNPIIKTPNGAIELKEIREGREIINKGNILGK